MSLKSSIALIFLIIINSITVYSQSINKKDYKITIQTGHYARIGSIACTADNRFIITSSGDRTVKLWDKEGNLIRTLTGHQGDVNDISLTSNPSLIMSSSDDRTLKIWDINTGECVKTLTRIHGSPHGMGIVSPDFKYASSFVGHLLFVWELDKGSVKVKVGVDCISAINFSSDSNNLICDYDRKQIASIDIKKKKAVIKADLKNDEISGKAIFSPDGKFVFYKTGDSLVFRNLEDGNTIKFGSDSDEIWGMAVSADNKFLLTGSRSDNSACLYNGKGELLKTFKYGESPEAVGITPDNNYIVSGLMNGNLNNHNMSDGSVKTIKDLSYGSIFSVKYSPDGKHIVFSAGDDMGPWQGKTVLMNNRFEILNEFGEDEEMAFGGIDFSPDGGYIADAKGDHINIYDTNGALIKEIKGKDHRSYRNIRISPDGKFMLAFGDDKIQIFDFKEFKLLKVIDSRSGFHLMDINPDSKTFAVQNNSDIEIRGMDGELVKVLNVYNNNNVFFSNCLVYSPDGKYLAVDNSDEIVIVDIASGKNYRRLKGKPDEDWVTSITFSPDGRYIVSGNRNGSLNIWETDSGRLIKKLTDHTNSITGAAFSPDGRFLITSSEDTSLKIYNFASFKSLTLFPVKDKNRIIYDNEGNYDCTDKVRKMIKFIKGFDVYDESEMSVHFYKKNIFDDLQYVK